MTQIGIIQANIAKNDAPLLRRLLAKLVIDVLPAALTSVIGGLLITQYQFNHAGPRLPAEQAAPASAEMVQLVRDEHAAIMDYLKAQMAAEKSRNAAADAADARAAAAAKVAAETPAPARVAPAAVVAVKAASRNKPSVTASLPPREPLAIAQAGPVAGPVSAAQSAPQPKSLLARTLDIKDHVVGATLHVVSAIGGIPSWIASIGDHGGTEAPPSGAGQSFSS